MSRRRQIAGREIVDMIDGMEAIEACYYFAGIIGVPPARLSLRDLWRLACGRLRQSRSEIIELSAMVWAMADYDIEAYLAFGSLDETGRGKAVKLDPELQSRVDEEIEKIRRENPGLPQVKAIK